MKNPFQFLSSITTGIKSVFQRFPIPAIFGIAGSLIGILFVHDIDDGLMPNILWTLFLGFPLFVAIQLWCEKRTWTQKKKELTLLGGTLLLIGYFFLLPPDMLRNSHHHILQSIMWIIGFVLLVTFVPFIHTEKKAHPAFWNFNKTLFLKGLQAAFYAGTTFLGIAAALWAIESLFEVTIHGERYGEIWMVCAGIIAPFFFLYSLPKKPTKDTKIDSSKALSIFTNYILIPLVTIYFIILYAYTSKIVLTWEWPKGIVSYMIFAFSLVGIATHLCIHPRISATPWLKRFHTLFYSLLIPQTIVLFLAIGMRINQYGITEKRYLVVILGLWLLGMALYNLISKRKDIRLIPITLFGLAFLSSFGPWGAFSVARESQLHRLESLLTHNNLLQDKTIIKAPDPEKISFEDQKEISATIRYLHNYHSLDVIQPWFETDLESLSQHTNEKTGAVYTNHYSIPEKTVEELLGLEYTNQWEARQREQNLYRNLQSLTHRHYNVAGFDYILPVYSQDFATQDTRKTRPQDRLSFGGHEHEFFIEISTQSIVHRIDRVLTKKISLKKHLENLPIEDISTNKIPEKYQTFLFENKSISLKLIIEHINYSREKSDEDFRLESLSGQLMFRTKDTTQLQN